MMKELGRTFSLCIVVVCFAPACNEKMDEANFAVYKYAAYGKEDSTSPIHYLFSAIKRKNVEDSVFIYEYVSLYRNEADYKLQYDENTYLLLHDTLYKKYLDTISRTIYLPYLIYGDTNAISAKQFSDIVSDKEYFYHLVEKNEQRKFIAADSLTKFLVENDEIDGVSYYSFFDSNHVFNKRENIRGFTDIKRIERIADTFVLDKSFDLKYREYLKTIDVQ